MADEEKGSQQFQYSSIDGEKRTADNLVQNTNSTHIDIDLETWGEEHGYVLDVEVLKGITPKWGNYELLNDGRTVNTFYFSSCHVQLYEFGLKDIGYFYFTPIVAAILGEIAGHWLHDAIATALTQRSKEKKLEPEFRLMAIAISTPFMLSGLVLLGFALENAYHYMIAALGWGLYVFGIMITTVVITAYCLDSYPEGSGEVAAWINFARTTGGFIISYFQVTWANAMGTKKSFGIQAAICVFAYLIIVTMQIFGKKMRERAGPLRFKTD